MAAGGKNGLNEGGLHLRGLEHILEFGEVAKRACTHLLHISWSVSSHGCGVAELARGHLL